MHGRRHRPGIVLAGPRGFAVSLTAGALAVGALAAALAWMAASAPAAAQQAGRLGAVLQGLDKTTARVSTIEAPIDETVHFGTLEIVARACHKKPPTETPESTVFLEIIDVRPDSPAVRVFMGWMFASSPAVSALEHPVYDIWVIDCREMTVPEEPAASDTEDTEAPVGEAKSDPAMQPNITE